MIQLRVRGPTGQATLKVEPSSSVAEFQQLLADRTGVQQYEQELLSGFPPRPLQLPEDCAATTVASLGIQAGDSLTVNRMPNAAPPAAAPATAAAAGAVAVDMSNFSVDGMSEDEQLARALALSMEENEAHPSQPPPQADPRSAAAAAAAARSAAAPPPAAAVRAAAPTSQQHPPQQQQQPRPPPRAAAVHGSSSNGSQQGAAATVGLPDSATVSRRIMDDDNSCLFNAVGYVMERSRSKAPALRRLVAQEVSADPLEWNEAVLGKSPPEYCAWICQPNTWGGAIELSILSKHYQREIAAFDIQTQRVDVYGQSAGYAERAMVIYDGLHYDALAVAAYPGAPESGDITLLPVVGPACEAAMAHAAALVAEAHAARQFTDTANFTLRCGICKLGLKGEAAAVAHAKETGHTSFAEFS